MFDVSLSTTGPKPPLQRQTKALWTSPPTPAAPVSLSLVITASEHIKYSHKTARTVYTVEDWHLKCLFLRLACHLVAMLCNSGYVILVQKLCYSASKNKLFLKSETCSQFHSPQTHIICGQL